MSVALSTEAFSTEVLPAEELMRLRQASGRADLSIVGFSPEAISLPTPILRQRAPGRRRFRMDWEAAAVILLMIVCAAVCAYRILWSIHV